MPQFSKRSSGRTPNNSEENKKPSKKAAKSPKSKSNKHTVSPGSSGAPSPIVSSQTHAQAQKEKEKTLSTNQNQKDGPVAGPQISSDKKDQTQADFGMGFVASSTPISEHPQDSSVQDSSPQTLEISSPHGNVKKDSMPELASVDVASNSKGEINKGNSQKVQKSQVSSHLTDMAPVPTEATPLLQGTDLENWAGVGLGVNERTRGFRGMLSHVLHNRTIWRTLLLFVFLIGFMAILVSQIDFQKLADNAIKTDVQSVSVLGIHDKGVEFQVTATVETDYDNVNNTFLRYMARTGGLLAGGVVITPKDNCSVFFSTDTIKDVHLMDVFPPEIAVDLIDHRVSNVDFVGNAVFAEAGAGQLFKTIFEHGFGNPLTLNIEVRLAPKIQGKWFGFELKTASIFHELEIPPLTKAWPHDIQDISVVAKNNQTQIKLSTSVPPLPAKMSFEQIQWNIAFPDCIHRPVIIGNGMTSGLTLDPSFANNVTFSGTVDKIPSELLHECSTGLTPVNDIVRQIVNDKVLGVFISAQNNDLNRQALPSWLLRILSSQFFYISAPLSFQEESFTKGTLSDYEINSSNLRLATNDLGNLEVRADAKASVTFNISSAIDIDMGISSIRSTICVSEFEDMILKVLIPGTGDMYMTNESPSRKRLSLDYRNLSIAITDPSVTGQHLNSILTDSYFDFPDWTLELEEVVVDSPLMSGLIKDLRFENKKAKKQELLSAQRSSKFVKWLLNNSQISTDQILLVTSSSKRAEFVVDFQLTNPLNVTIGVANDALRFDVKYNKTTIGILSIENFEVPNSRERLSLSANLVFFYDSESQRALAEEFMSRVISGSTDLVLGIAGSQTAPQKTETGLSKLLKEIRIDEIPLPSLNFTIPNESQSKISTNILRASEESHSIFTSEQKQSPFLIDATFYMWSSEIQLTVFNPIANSELKVRIIDCLASYKGESLAHINWSELLVIPPGIYVTPRIPIKISSGIGADILRKAMNGGLAMDVVAELSVVVDQFPAELMYRGTGLTAKVKL